MTRRVVKSGTGLVQPRAIWAAALGGFAVGALAVGAVAIGALAIGRLAVGRLTVDRFAARRTRIDHLSIGTLTVERIDRPAAGLGSQKQEARSGTEVGPARLQQLESLNSARAEFSAATGTKE